MIEKEKMERAKEICNDGSILEIKPLQPKKAAILTTGSEVYHGRIQDKFTPVLVEKLKEYGSEVIFHEIYDDDNEAITKGCLSAIEQGAELVLCTGGMSVDPDDNTACHQKYGRKNCFLRCTSSSGSNVFSILL